jgi:CheY-like chemotaxis protein
MQYSNILFIDDDGDDRGLLQDAAAEISPDLFTLALDDARDALRKIDAGEIAPDLIVIDLNMPCMSGQEFISEMRHRTSRVAIPIVVLSTAAHSDIIKQVKALGANQYFTKPDTFDGLKDLLRGMVYHLQTGVVR